MFLIDIIFNSRTRLGLLALSLCLAGCESLFFYPMKEHVRSPADIDLAYSDVRIASSDGVSLHGWFLPAQGEAKGTVYFLHGNAENISTHIASVYWLPERGYQVFMLDYRGYGLSTGVPTLPEVLVDIKKGWQWLLQQPQVQQVPLYILGQSLGAAMAGYVVATEPELKKSLTAVALDAGFASYPQVAKEAAAKHWLTWPWQWAVHSLLGDEYNLEKVIGQIPPTPLLLIHGRHDNIISAQQIQQLYDRAGQPKQLLQYDGPHIATFQQPVNRKYLLRFFAQAAAGELVAP
ncbi:lysophospholipase [Dasania sp. GY-MA-18]|uniref:Lysophospholipase n=1 Tax=Dasania phycosphaerae TaxID=2950436 RepID=A0A9J6RMT5_9GAMM|nr:MULTISPECIES: lysophospholipase [Dasania]MCR8923072.1 lysophospholipase [Dasania sp. GY-MA-18]MCZ0865504.1 lysophospholipase [Dasania phycosphaerae]MCZ0869229.1 lysophospholipase [Dasania phycosphaerae]